MWARRLGSQGRGWGMGATSADFDNDGDQDLYATQLRENLLFRNDGDRFVDVAAVAGVATRPIGAQARLGPTTTATATSTCTWRAMRYSIRLRLNAWGRSGRGWTSSSVRGD